MLNKEESSSVESAVESSLAEIKWRLRPSSNRRLNTDILALCNGMRSVIMIDYGGKLPELQLRLSSFLN
ncbi:B-box zinc finger family protein 24, partial [Tanacetum coccineum]